WSSDVCSSDLGALPLSRREKLLGPTSPQLEFFDGFVLHEDWVAAVKRQILPTRVHVLDQGNPFLAAPAFDLLFAVYGFAYIVEALKIDQAITSVPRREAFD